ncbi:MAG TPA: DUF3418 domain-containing protein [Tepidisphaeraceae bacterium]|jgi:ATP-dependent helicase HrpA|nr:DUF3418 domain-containing protein [Tepidisphaeraceae bacterium]
MFEPKKPLSPHKFDAIHRALLTGLISNVGQKTDPVEYTGLRGSKFNIHPSSALFTAKPSWITSAELVETTRLYARTVSRISPQWIERAADHLVKRLYTDPHWHKDSARVLAHEKVTLYSLLLVPRRTIHYGPLFPEPSRDLFILHALVQGQFRTDAPFFAHNESLKQQALTLEAKTRRPGEFLATPQSRVAFYNARILQGIFSGETFESWYHPTRRNQPRLLFMQPHDILTPAASTIPQDQYPDHFELDQLPFKLEYHLDPGGPLDGITAIIPLAILNQIPKEPFEWLVPGFLLEKITSLIRSLPKPLRIPFVPIPETAERISREIKFRAEPLLHSLAHHLGKITGTSLPPSSFNPSELPAYLHMNFRIIDDANKTIAQGRDLDSLRKSLRIEARHSFSSAPDPRYHKDNLTRWDFGDLPDRVEVRRHGMTLAGFPALLDTGSSVSLRLFDTPELASHYHHAGVRRLFLSQIRDEARQLIRNTPNLQQMALHFSTAGPSDSLKDDLVSAIADRAIFQDSADIRTQQIFATRSAAAWKKLHPAAREVTTLAADILSSYHTLAKELSRDFPPLLLDSVKDMRTHLSSLIHTGFLSQSPWSHLHHYPRYLKALSQRLQKLLNAGLSRDQASLHILYPLQRQYRDRLASHKAQGITDPALTDYRWLLEELRVSLFAQSLRTPVPISQQKVQKAWTLVRP